MEDLNKQQLILLTLLVSFVTSIATGIITFSLLQEAPVAVTQNINRVVERTIEKVVEDEKGEKVKEITTVVSEEDSILNSIEQNLKSLARIKSISPDGTEVFTGISLVVSDSGMMVADERSVGDTNHSVVFDDGAVYRVSKVFKDPNSNFVFLKLNKPSTDTYVFHPVSFANNTSLRLGQSVISISGREKNYISVGRVSSIQRTTDSKTKSINTDIRLLRSNPGSPILNLKGELIGVEGVEDENSSSMSYFSSEMIKNGLNTATIELAK